MMIDQDLIDKAEWELENSGKVSSVIAFELIQSYKKVIEDNANLHKVNAKLRTENRELYQESAKDKGL